MRSTTDATGEWSVIISVPSRLRFSINRNRCARCRDFGYYCAPSSLPSKMTQVARHRAARLRLTTSGRGGLISISLSSLFFSDPRFHELIRLQQRRCSAIPIHSAATAAAPAAAMIFSQSPPTDRPFVSFCNGTRFIRSPRVLQRRVARLPFPSSVYSFSPGFRLLPTPDVPMNRFLSRRGNGNRP